MGLAEMYMTFKLATSHTLDAITLIRAISDFKKPLTGLGGIDVIVKLATLGLINATRFFKNVNLDEGLSVSRNFSPVCLLQMLSRIWIQ